MGKNEESITHLFEQALLVSEDELELSFLFVDASPWEQFLLNPRRLRGSDFLMRWSQGKWSEDRLLAAIEDTGEFFAVPYGISSVAPDEDPRASELYFEFLERADAGEIKRPDLLVFPMRVHKEVQDILQDIGALPAPASVVSMEEQEDALRFFQGLQPEQRLPFFEESHPLLQSLIHLSLLAVEAENSLWITEMMPSFRESLRPMARLGGKPGLPKSAVTPTIIIKDEDLPLLGAWEQKNQTPVHIWHVFYDRAFGISLEEAVRLINDGYISGTAQTFQAPGGATTKKTIYKIYHHYAYPLATTTEPPTLTADRIIDKNGHILPYVRFSGGRIRLTEKAITVLRGLL